MQWILVDETKKYNNVWFILFYCLLKLKKVKMECCHFKTGTRSLSLDCRDSDRSDWGPVWTADSEDK